MPHPKKELFSLSTNSTYDADSAFEVALRVFWPKSLRVKSSEKFFLIPLIKAEIGPLPSLVKFLILLLYSIFASIISKFDPRLDAFVTNETS